MGSLEKPFNNLPSIVIIFQHCDFTQASTRLFTGKCLLILLTKERDSVKLPGKGFSRCAK